jgi:integrase
MRAILRGLGSLYRRKKRRPDGTIVELPKWWLKYYCQGRPIREPTGTTHRGLALRKLKARIREIEEGMFAGPKADRLRIGELLDGVLLHYKLNNRSYRDFARPAVNLHLRPWFGEIRARDLDTPRIQAYQLKRQAQGAAKSTINRECALLKVALNLARRQTPPRIKFVPYIPRLAENNVRKGFLEYAEFASLRGALDEDIQPILLFAYYTGCRLGEILSLTWSQVDLDHRIVRLEPGETKNGDPRHFVMVPDLYSTIAVRRTLRDKMYPVCPWVFFRQATGKHVRDFRGAWASACLATGLSDAQGEPTRIFHDLRRTGVRNLIRSGVPETVAMKISGHKTRSVFDRYNITCDRDLAEVRHDTRALNHFGGL